MSWIIKIIVWAAAGFVADKIMDGKPEGLLWNIGLGFVGGLVGSLVSNLIGLGSRGMIWDILLSAAGACLVIWLVRKFDLGRFLRR